MTTASSKMNIYFPQVWSMILTLPGLANLSIIETLFEHTTEIVPLDWRFPLLACQAVGGPANRILPVVGVMACMRKSIALVDDLLDDDPFGVHESIGVGRAANLALILQAAAGQLIVQCDVSKERQLLAWMTLNQGAIDTATGQDLDTQNLSGEENYWKLVQAKSTPYYVTAFKMGAQLGGANVEVVNQLAQFGQYLGEISQIYDDLEDAFQIPAEPDWSQGRNNLAILYGLTAEYDEKERFVELFNSRAQDSAIHDTESLEEMQQILTQSGAVSYCLYQVLVREQRARKLLDEMPLVGPEHLFNLFTIIRKHVIKFEELIGIQLPKEHLEPS
ncbi:polyprenyl synthetase family protein [Chloroflexi bacterium TSY]|nr:polyprenyl synthetase family protein [Chloroflexi bacterium TSY]